MRADVAVFTRVAGQAGAMGSRVMAHDSEASRAADPDARDGTIVAWSAVITEREGARHD